MIRDIVKDPLFLQKKAIKANKEDKLIGKDLQDTLNYHRESCLGLAANMIGENKRIIIVSMGFIDLLMFNPKIISKDKPYQTQESCLSLKGSRPTQRFEEIKVSYLDSNWKEKTLTLKGLAAQICQHEMDHLEGIII
ncbi:peptide deformylase [Streptococcus iniae]|uniref:Peptide deformylase n=1 Tax=Streptococcus iniae TaxID=1346 RepID=A0A3L8GII2_STRIN|nr:peptide deformylase [Streptococcus iniae]AGM98932.1 peptide deformylase [Streptococcus iniae SF1]AHY15884.1 peptide deformylase [Streptococcus iniae]AHY17752.1 peptide deformylase [Streptococcus iniae]AJG26047.1 peptide deformylase [Streptococcus iniae]APD31923.1 peptide deformylase [Streptococcus iniae]